MGALLLHELGHVVGLGHTPDSAQIMYPDLRPMSSAQYQPGDLGGLARLGATQGCLTVPAAG
jgi:predicted Zn-dependent protease